MDRISKLKEFLQNSPNDNFVQHALALEYVKIGEDEQAKEEFENILNNDENYIGSYYHLAKLLERMELRDDAIKWYEKGIRKAKEVGDQHAYSELMSAYEDYVY